MAKISPTLFREYDIRGLVDQDLTEEAVFLIGKALGTKVRAAGGFSISLDSARPGPHLCG